SAGEDREASRGTKGPRQDEGTRPGDHGPERRTQPRAGGGAAAKLPDGMAGVLSPRGHAEDFRRRGSVASPPIAHAHRQTPETRPHAVPDTARSGNSRTRGSGSGGAL